MTRSTASESCSRICATDSSVIAVSPRRCVSSKRQELSIAAAPPFTATYISDSFQSAHARRAGQAQGLLAAGKHNVHTLREGGVVGLPLRPEIIGQTLQADALHGFNTWAVPLQRRAAQQGGHVDEKRGGKLGCLRRARRKVA